MKKVAFPLLLASSAKAESRVDAAMAADKAVPKPILIADVWFTGDCEDAAGEVADAATAVGTATAALETLVTEREPLATAVDDALAAKGTANAAVIAADAALANDLEADDSAQGTLLVLKRALDDATYAESAAV